MAQPAELAFAVLGIQSDATRMMTAAAKQISIPICAQFRAFPSSILAVSRSMIVSGYLQRTGSAVVDIFITSNVWLVQSSIKIALITQILN
jgi:hypothetical protein